MLAASSPLISEMLRNIKHQNPIIYFWDLKARDILLMVHFMYKGEVEVYQSDLDDLLKVGQRLGIKGLMEPNQKEEPVLHAIYDTFESKEENKASEKVKYVTVLKKWDLTSPREEAKYKDTYNEPKVKLSVKKEKLESIQYKISDDFIFPEETSRNHKKI